MLGLESVGDAVTPSSTDPPGLLLRLHIVSRMLLPSTDVDGFAGQAAVGVALLPPPVAVLQTESSERDRMKRVTLPVPERAASMRVPGWESANG